MVKNRGKDWIVLRMAASSTLPLVQSLADAGLEVWTPIETQTRRWPRSSKCRDVRLALMSTYIFARASWEADLLEIAASPLSPHRNFSVMHRDGGTVYVSDHDLIAVREFEEELARSPGKAAPLFKRGQLVRAPDTAFEGMDGMVVDADGTKVMVTFGGWHIPVEIGSSNLVSVHVESPQPEQGTAAAQAA